VTTTFHAGETEEAATRLGKSWIAVAPRSDVFAEIMRLLPEGPVYFAVTDPRFAAKLRKIDARTSHAANLRLLLVDGDDAGGIPPGAPASGRRPCRSFSAVPPAVDAGAWHGLCFAGAAAAPREQVARSGRQTPVGGERA
jgi:hypothetical protein